MIIQGKYTKIFKSNDMTRLKYDIAVSTVHASYTSKMCPMCGCIEDENRPTQETFECIECGYKDNADFNAAKNIKN